MALNSQKRRFPGRAVSPDCARELRTAGAIAGVHANGRVVYAGQPFRADGADGLCAAAANAQEAAELEAREQDILVLIWPYMTYRAVVLLGRFSLMRRI
jgi:hypothetical protein